jgi:ABC-2 type transport system ATP-binding protein
MHSNSLLSLHNISKTYRVKNERTGKISWLRDLFQPNFKEKLALNSVSLNILEGECVGLLGPNGAGKSTLIKILCGIQKPSSGKVSMLGQDPTIGKHKLLCNVAVVFGHKSSLWWNLPVIDSFEAIKKIYKIDEPLYKINFSELVEAFQLHGVLNSPVRALSLGERVKCEIASKLLYSPKIILLDEPTIGLDALAKTQLRLYIKHYVREKNCGVLITSHDTRDIEECCNRVILLNYGEVKFNGSVNSLAEKVKMPNVLKIRSYSDTFSEKDHSFIINVLEKHSISNEIISVTNKEITIKINSEYLGTTNIQCIGDLMNSDIQFQIDFIRPSLETIILSEYIKQETTN